MKLALRCLSLLALVFLAACTTPTPVATVAPPTGHLQDGDLLFQSLPHSPLVDAIEGCTQTPFSHCGIAHQTPAGWVVIEAIGPVRESPIAQFFAQGRGAKYAVYRLRPAYQKYIPAMIAETRRFYGLPYDAAYRFDDEKIYCSELIFKAYRAASGEALGIVQTLGELNWQPSQAVIEKINDGPVPLNRAMITPRSLSEAYQLELVGENLPP